MGDTTTIDSLGTLISGIYNYSLKLVGLAVFGMFLLAGFKMMFGKKAEAIKIIQDAVIGAVLLLSAYVILNTISPDLVGQNGNTIPTFNR